MTQRSSTAAGPPLVGPLLHDGFYAWAALRPDALALVTETVTLSYRELARRVATVRWELLDSGVAPGDRVAVVVRKGWEGVVGLLAAVGVGAAYVPVDADLPAERIRQLLDDAWPACVLTEPNAAAAAFGGVPSVTIADGARLRDGAVPDPPIAPDDLCYIIYTSGSTGRPKGVMIEHRAATNTIADVNRRFGIGPDDVSIAVSPFSFDLSVYDVFGTLAAGGRLVVPDARLSRTPRHLLGLMAAHAVTVWNSAPPVLELLVKECESRGERLPASLRLVMLSGDWIDVRLPDRIRRLADGVRIVSLGGATEASIWSVAYPIDRVDPAWKSIPYGRPLDNQTWHVLDEAMQPCAAGQRGMLYIGGAGLARGYWNDPQKTACAFVTHRATGERIYRTGDFGRLREDGTLEILGREDTQVKIRGYRVELGEIEATLLACEGARSARVVLDPDRPPGAGGRSPQDLLAVVVPAPGSDLTVAALRAHCRRSLPAYMVPGTIALVAALPLTANGKVDLKALARLVRAGGGAGTERSPSSRQGCPPA